MKLALNKEYTNPEDENNFKLGLIYTNKNATNIFKLFYYIFITIVGYYVLHELEYFPKSLGGNGDIALIFNKGHPETFFHIKPKYFNYYFLGALAFHLTDLFWLIFFYELQSDFLMMFLHHLCTIALVVFSYLSNYSNIGSVILVLHDFGDIFVYIARLSLNTNSRKSTKLSTGILLIIVYIYTRIYALGDMLYTIMDYILLVQNWIESTMMIFQCFLYVLHIYWVYLITKKVVTAAYFNKYEDSFELKIKKY